MRGSEDKYELIILRTEYFKLSMKNTLRVLLDIDHHTHGTSEKHLAQGHTGSKPPHFQ